MGAQLEGWFYLAGTKLNPSRFARAEKFESQQAKKMGPWRRSSNIFADAKCIASWGEEGKSLSDPPPFERVHW